MWVRAIAVVLMVMGSAQVWADGVDLRLSDESAEFSYLFRTPDFTYGGADVGVGIFFNEDDDLMASASWLMTGRGVDAAKALHYGIGVKAYLISVDEPSQDGGALAIGGQVRYVVPAQLQMAVLAEGFLAPKITSFSDVESVKDFRVAAEFEVTPSTKAYLGYRVVEVDLDEDGDYEMDSDVHVGVRLSF